jgi:hypothetical protein
MRKVALLLLVAPLVLAACGGSSNTKTNGDSLANVKNAAQKTADVSGVHMEMTGSLGVGPTSATLTGSGDFDNAANQGQTTLKLNISGQDVTIVGVLDGTTIYIQSRLFTPQLPNGKTWIKLDLDRAGASQGINYSSLLSFTPTQALEQLEAAQAAKSVGTDEIDGTETTHYQVTNLDPTQLPKGVKALGHPKYGPIDVWIGNKDGYVYRESFSLSFPKSGKTPATSTSMQMDLSKFGEKVNVTVPPENEVFDASAFQNGGPAA